jgi:hypothetical protein
MALLDSRRPAQRKEGPLNLPPWRGGLAAPLLAIAVGPAFCSGLFGLAVLPTQGVAVPRWLILAYGFGCVLMALAAALLGRSDDDPRPSGQQDHRPPTGGRESTDVLLLPSGDGPAARPGRRSEHATLRA